jgi:hypothetical protein
LRELSFVSPTVQRKKARSGEPIAAEQTENMHSKKRAVKRITAESTSVNRYGGRHNAMPPTLRDRKLPENIVFCVIFPIAQNRRGCWHALHSTFSPQFRIRFSNRKLQFASGSV